MNKGSAETISDLIPGHEAKGLHASSRFAVRPTGGVRQRLKSPGRMPEETRPYQAGDPINLIDWRAYGRTDQLLMRLQQEQAPMDVRVQVSLHDSMHWPIQGVDFDEAAFGQLQNVKSMKTKAELAWRLAMFVGFAVLRRGDSCRFDISEKFTWKPKSTRMVQDVFHWLADNQFGLNWQGSARDKQARDKTANDSWATIFSPLGSGDARAANSDQKVSGVRRVLISDGMEADTVQWQGRMGGLAAGDLFVHVLSEMELDSSWIESGHISDAVFTETDPTLRLMRKRSRREWHESSLRTKMAAARWGWLASIDAFMQKRGVQVIRLTGANRIDGFIGEFDSWYGGAGKRR